MSDGKVQMPIKRVVDLRAIIDLPAGSWFWRCGYGTPEYWDALASALENEAKDLMEFIHDHRSRDAYQITIEREYEEQCPFCGYRWEIAEDGLPVCCDKAQEEWIRQQEV